MAETLVQGVDELRGVGSLNVKDPASRLLTPTEEKTDDVSKAALAELAVPAPSDRLFPSRVVELNPGFEALQATLLYEKRGIEQLGGTEKDTQEQLKIIDQLLDLSTELTALKDMDKNELSAKVQSMLNDLKAKGLDLFKGNPKAVAKEQLTELKSVISARVDRSRAQVQQIFTKMQNIVQNMMSVNDSGKRMISDFAQLLRTISRNSGSR